MKLSHLNWASIVFGAAAGLFTSLLLFAVSAGLGANTLVQIALQFVGFFVAGYVAGRFALVEPTLSGGLSSLILFFGITAVTVGGTGLNIVAIVVLGMVSAFIGTMAGGVGFARQKD
jgi:hypothetical protein